MESLFKIKKQVHLIIFVLLFFALTILPWGIIFFISNNKSDDLGLAAVVFAGISFSCFAFFYNLIFIFYSIFIIKNKIVYLEKIYNNLSIMFKLFGLFVFLDFTIALIYSAISSFSINNVLMSFNHGFAMNFIFPIGIISLINNLDRYCGLKSNIKNLIKIILIILQVTYFIARSLNFLFCIVIFVMSKLN